MNNEHVQPRGAHLSWDFNIGTVLTAAAMATALIVWLVTGQNKSVETQRNLDLLQQSMTAQIAELRAATTGGLADVRRQIESLPDERAQLADLQRRVGEMAQNGSAGRAALDTRLSAVERTTIELRADLNNIMRASSVPLPEQRR